MTTRTRDLYLDRYERQVRYAPGLLALLPISITVAVLGLDRFAPVSIAIGVLASAGGPALLADLVRDRGHAVQVRLYREWGGLPTTRLLRTREVIESTVRRDKWRLAVEKLTGVVLPTEVRETADPAAADIEIESAVDDLRDMFRDKERFVLLDHELRAYGYRRNMRGIKAWGIGLAVLGVLAMIATLALSSNARSHPGADYAAIAIDVLAVAFWLVVVRDKWVKVAADRYAIQLMQAAVVKSKD